MNPQYTKNRLAMLIAIMLLAACGGNPSTPSPEVGMATLAPGSGLATPLVPVPPFDIHLCNVDTDNPILATFQFMKTGDEPFKAKFGGYSAVLESDGNFAIYNYHNILIWDSGYHGVDGDWYAIMQSDGNFVVYPGVDPDNRTGDAVWSSGVTGNEGDYYATIRGDGTFAVCSGSSPTDRSRLIWDSGRFFLEDSEKLETLSYLLSPTRNHKAIMENDGNLCVYKIGSGDPVWCTGETGQPGHPYGLEFAHVHSLNSVGQPTLKPNGLIVVSGESVCTPGPNLTIECRPKTIWSSGVTGTGDKFFLTLRDDGTLSVYEGTPVNREHIVWNSGKQILNEGEFLLTDSVLQSPSKEFFAVQQGDGSLVAYSGSRQHDIPGPAIWSIGAPTINGEHYLLLEENGLSMYKGDSPTDDQSQHILTIFVNPYRESPDYGDTSLELDNNGVLLYTIMDPNGNRIAIGDLQQEKIYQLSDEGRKLSSNLPVYTSNPDEDHDGVSDNWENNLIELTKPMFILDEEEDWLAIFSLNTLGFNLFYDNAVLYAQVTPAWNGATRYILSYYAVTWSRDYGRFCDASVAGSFDWLCLPHTGDVERVVMAWEVIDDYTIRLRWVYTSAHDYKTLHSGVWDADWVSSNTGYYWNRSEENREPETMTAKLWFLMNRLILWVSEDKHAIYPSSSVCDNVRLVELDNWPDIGEDCGEGGAFLFDAYNVGEFGSPLIDDVGNIFAGEFVWNDPDGRFCGGYSCDDNSPDYIGSKFIEIPDELQAVIGLLP